MKFFKRYFLKIAYPLAIIYWFITRPETVGTRVMVFNSKGEVLLIKHSYRSRYFLPGGGVKSRESLEECARREVFEEANIKIGEIGFHGLFRRFVEFKNDNLIIFVSEDVKNEDEVKADNIEIIDANWFPVDNLPEDTQPGTVRRIQEYKSNRHKVYTKW